MSEGRINYLHQLAIKAGSKFTLFLFLVQVLKNAVRFEQLFFQSYNGNDKGVHSAYFAL